MRKIYLIIIFVSFTFQAFSQEADGQKTTIADTLVLISGRKVPVIVQGVSPSRITYFTLGETETKDVDRKQIHKILYRNGRVEHLNSLAVQMVDEGDWQTVILTDNRDDVEGFFALGEVQAQSSPRSRNARSAQRSADIRLKKRAVNMGGLVVLITKRESRGGYGETPTHFVEGVVYGFDPPADM